VEGVNARGKAGPTLAVLLQDVGSKEGRRGDAS
jgi:hypothetical protein